jgi:DNA-directed RNA polymerase specialized sigma24 family protein
MASAYRGEMTNPAAAPPESEVLTAAEMRAAIAVLSPADLLRLKKAARLFGRLMGMDPDDLVQEAVVRAMEDARHCRRAMKVIMFLIGTMRSVASARRKSADARRVVRSVDDDAPSGGTPVMPADACTTEEEHIVEQEFWKKRVEAVFELFRDDEDATLWLMARMDTDTLAEAQAATGFDATKINTVGRRVRRKVERAFPEGLRQ